MYGIMSNYSRALPNIKDILAKHRHILQANQGCLKGLLTHFTL